MLLLTNNQELSKVINESSHFFEYSYEIKVHGRFTEEKLIKIRKGAKIKGKKFGPFYCKVKKYLRRNTKLLMKTNNASMRDIKMILQKNDL